MRWSNKWIWNKTTCPKQYPYIALHHWTSVANHHNVTPELSSGHRQTKTTYSMNLVAHFAWSPLERNFMNLQDSGMWYRDLIARKAMCTLCVLAICVLTQDCFTCRCRTWRYLHTLGWYSLEIWCTVTVCHDKDKFRISAMYKYNKLPFYILMLLSAKSFSIFIMHVVHL